MADGLDFGEGAASGALSPIASDLDPSSAEGSGFLKPLPDGRLLLHMACEGVLSTSGGGVPVRIGEGSLDLSILNSGRAPLLLEHLRPLEFLAGIIEAAWAADGILFARARLAKLPRLADVAALIDAGILVNCSVGMLLQHHAVADGEGVHTVSRWRPYEVSLCSIPRGWCEFRRR
jgi:hypothetical protein